MWLGVTHRCGTLGNTHLQIISVLSWWLTPTPRCNNRVKNPTSSHPHSRATFPRIKRKVVAMALKASFIKGLPCPGLATVLLLTLKPNCVDLGLQGKQSTWRKCLDVKIPVCFPFDLQAGIMNGSILFLLKCFWYAVKGTVPNYWSFSKSEADIQLGLPVSWNCTYKETPGAMPLQGPQDAEEELRGHEGGMSVVVSSCWSIVEFLFAFLIVCIYVCQMCVCACVYKQEQEVNVTYLPQLLSTLCFWERVSHWACLSLVG